MRRSLPAVFLFWVAICANLDAQRLQPELRPATSAANMSWYLAAEPLPIFGDYYYPAGPTVFFRPNQMVASTSYSGVTIYTDPTLEPFSVIFVPIGNGLMRPYERRRPAPGEVTVNPLLSASAALPAPPPPTSRSTISPSVVLESAPRPVGTTGVVTRIAPAPRPVGTAGAVMITPSRSTSSTSAQRTRMTPLARPRATAGVWIEFLGVRWRAAGKAEEFSEGLYVHYGDYRSNPVYILRGADPSNPDVIYVPAASGRVTPYMRERR